MLRRRERWRPRRPPGEPVLVLCPEGDHRDETIACEKAKRSNPFPRFRKKGRSDELGEKVLSDSRCFFSSKCFFADATPGFFFPFLSQRIPLPLAAALGRLFFHSPGECLAADTYLGRLAVTKGSSARRQRPPWPDESMRRLSKHQRRFCFLSRGASSVES